MINTLERTLKIEVVEDCRTDSALLKKKLSKNIEGCKIIQRDRPEYLFSDLGFERPLIIVLDWNFPGYNSAHLIPRLSKYKGLVCVFSSEDPQIIRNSIIDIFGELPKNIKVFSKLNYREMQHEIITYIDNNF